MSIGKKLWAMITRKGSEEGQYPIQQATYLGRVSDFFILFPYGMHANLPVDQLGLLIDNKGRVFMGTSAIGRITVEQGEVVFYHPQTKSKFHFKNNGDVDLNTVSEDEGAVQGNININTKNVSITSSEKVTLNSTGDVDVTTSGDANVTATNVNIDASVTNLGVGGQPIARTGDTVEVAVVGGSSAGTHTGTITGGGNNTSI